ncbi:hypothetical protein [Gracilibacillus salinarum]|uniref:Holliday junction nuclease RuvC n=1 Tax=Gracilibacillus salinarum TaxID=2932255 RepID=A0ABY4GMS6_9BACI|nr:hypothetical protein [Gracilibacillus salinarum]UOQ85678.1 hypothetical protein MUN87_01865 [Gracilibacillus salinarum]
MRFIGIDPASKTGFVALDEQGQVLRAKELTGIGDKDPKRMTTLIYDIMQHIQSDDIICIEGFPFQTQKAMFAGGLHHGIRNELFRRGLKYYEVAPNAVKKFVNETGWTGEPGNKKRLKGAAKKRAVMKAVQEHYGFEHPSDNVVDAYIMAHIALAAKKGTVQHSYQADVLTKVKLA